MIFYLSCTGNTKWAAQTLGAAIDDTIINILDTEEAEMTYTLAENERIGFCFPVHGWRPPKVLRSFISRLHISNAAGHYCYAVATAGDTVGEAVDILKGDLACRNILLNSAFSLIMPESYVGLPFMDVDTPEKEAAKKAKAEADMKRISGIVERKEAGVYEVTIGRWPKINSRLIGGLFTDRMITDKPFRVTADRCLKCGACVKACPTGNVTPDGSGMPQWNHDGSCLACFACYHHCPTHAIEYGRRTKKKGQYFFDRRKI